MQCKACKKTFPWKYNLKRHEEKCQGVFKCEELDLKLYNNSYERHGRKKGKYQGKNKLKAGLNTA